MNLINKRLLAQRIEGFEFPTGNKQENIKKLIEGWQKALKDSDLDKTKEKSVQGKFLQTFFEEILGYVDITSGDSEWTLIQHPRIENDSLEPDGSLGWFTKQDKLTRAVIELKDAQTSLDKKQSSRAGKYTPIEQAYLYSTKYTGCNWIIVSNFKEIRLFNKQKTQEYYEKFDVLDLNSDAEFKRFYYVLSKENLISKDKESVIDTLAKDTSEAEQDITKKFYSEFKQIRLKLLDHLVNNNLEISKDVLLEKTQKLLDRFIFILFCEDTSNLLPLHIVKNTYERAINSLSPSDERVWLEFKGLFLAIDKGNERVKPPINAYNGGLFAYDSILDNLHIKDEFWSELMQLASYDFETDLNVNILGHIFEQSISDIEALKSELIGESQDNKKSKRKKDGIYYTPEYITHYIVENTIGKYIEEHSDRLETIKIIDPACGSGAFLNQAHSFLRKQWNIAYQEGRVKNKDAEFGALFDFNPVETDKSILLNNLYGVDLNQESVEITKLALWLKTARNSEPLQNLDRNIMNGNSLIDNLDVVGDKAFDWKKEFKETMDNGGFDIVIGNPPYVSNKQLHKNGQYLEKDWIDKSYISAKSGNYDLYIPFIERGLSLLKEGGYLSFIIPNKFLVAKYSQTLLSLIREKYNFIEIVDFSNTNVFEDVSVYPIVITIQKAKGSGDLVQRKYMNKYSPSPVQEEMWNYQYQKPVYQDDSPINKIMFKIDNIKSCNDELSFQPGINGFQFENYGKCISGKKVEASDKRIIVTGNIDPFVLQETSTKYKGITYSTAYIHFDANIISEMKWKLFSTPKVLIAGMTKKIEAALDKNGVIAPGVSVYSILSETVDLRQIVGILNSKLINWYFNMRFNDKHLSGGYISMNNMLLKQIPFCKNLSNELLDLVDRISILKIHFNEINLLAYQFLLEEYSLDPTSKKLKNIFDLGWNEFNLLLAKGKIDLDLSKKEKLLTWFKTKQNELHGLKNEINLVDIQINKEIYNLYHLTEEEIKIIEDSILK